MQLATFQTAHMWVSAGPWPLRTAVTVNGICLPRSLSCHISDTGQGGRKLLLDSLDRTLCLWLFHKHCPVSTLMSSPTVLIAPFLYLGVGSRHHWFAAVPFPDHRMSTSFCAIPACFTDTVNMSKPSKHSAEHPQNLWLDDIKPFPPLTYLCNCFSQKHLIWVVFYSLRIWQVHTQLF